MGDRSHGQRELLLPGDCEGQLIIYFEVGVGVGGSEHKTSSKRIFTC